MITTEEEDYIRGHAYLPEHITGYVMAISNVEPSLINNYLCYFDGKKQIVFVGYPFESLFEESLMKEALDAAIERFKPDQIALIAPVISISQGVCSKRESDYYYKLELSNLHIHQKLKNIIKRASRELYIEKGHELSDEHIQLISEFLDSHRVNAETRYIFERIPQYVSSVPSASVFSVRDRARKLVAFDIAEFGAKDYAFYMFNFISRHQPIPGASDLLLYEVIKAAKEEGKSAINLGLGINKGVKFFKKKWGGIPFLNYEFCLYQPARMEWLKSLFKKL